MKYKKILALDPSGNFNEGKGTTGWCIYEVEEKLVSITDFISAKKYETQESYWGAHILLIEKYKETYGASLGIVLEDYMLYEHKMKTQTHSRMETPKVIGVLEYHCWTQGYECHKQAAHEVKNRWADPILLEEGIIQVKGTGVCIPGQTKRINRHCKDAIRHAVHFGIFKNN